MLKDGRAGESALFAVTTDGRARASCDQRSCGLTALAHRRRVIFAARNSHVSRESMASGSGAVSRRFYQRVSGESGCRGAVRRIVAAAPRPATVPAQQTEQRADCV